MFLADKATQEGLINDPTIWLDGARTPTKYIIAQSNNNTFGVLAIFCCEYIFHAIGVFLKMKLTLKRPIHK